MRDKVGSTAPLSERIAAFLLCHPSFSRPDIGVLSGVPDILPSAYALRFLLRGAGTLQLLRDFIE